MKRFSLFSRFLGLILMSMPLLVSSQGSDPVAISNLQLGTTTESPFTLQSAAKFEATFVGESSGISTYRCEWTPGAGNNSVQFNSPSTFAKENPSGSKRYRCFQYGNLISEATVDAKVTVFEGSDKKGETTLSASSGSFAVTEVASFEKIREGTESTYIYADFKAKFASVKQEEGLLANVLQTESCYWEYASLNDLSEASGQQDIDDLYATNLTIKPSFIEDDDRDPDEKACEFQLRLPPGEFADYSIRLRVRRGTDEASVEQTFVWEDVSRSMTIDEGIVLEVNIPSGISLNLTNFSDNDELNTKVLWEVAEDSSQNIEANLGDSVEFSFANAGSYNVTATWQEDPSFQATALIEVVDPNAQQTNTQNNQQTTTTEGFVETNEDDPIINCDADPSRCWQAGDLYTGPIPEVKGAGSCVTHLDEKLTFVDNGGQLLFRPVPPKRSAEPDDYWGCFCYQRLDVDGVPRTEWYTTVFEEVQIPGQQGTKKYPYAQKVKYCVQLDEAIGDATALTGETGAELYGNYVQLIYRYAAMTIGIVVVLVIVVSGIQIIAGGASPEGVSAAKERIMQAILSMVILFGASAILQTINPNFFKVDIDSDNDKMPDYWEVQYGLDKLDPTDAGVDTDGDSQTNLEEYENSLKRSDTCYFRYKDPTVNEDFILGPLDSSCN